MPGFLKETTDLRLLDISVYAEGMQGSTLLQVDCAPTAQLALGITGVQRGLAAAAYRAHAATSAAGRDPADEDAGASPASSGGAAAGAGSALLQGSSGGLNRSLALTGENLPLKCPFKAHRVVLQSFFIKQDGAMIHIYDVPGAYDKSERAL